MSRIQFTVIFEQHREHSLLGGVLDSPAMAACRAIDGLNTARCLAVASARHTINGTDSARSLAFLSYLKSGCVLPR